MKLYKKIIDGVIREDRLRLIPSPLLLKMASILIVKTKDSLILLKNRNSHWKKGNLFIGGDKDEAIPIETLDYTLLTFDEIVFDTKPNAPDYTEKLLAFKRKLIDQPYILYRSK